MYIKDKCIDKSSHKKHPSETFLLNKTDASRAIQQYISLSPKIYYLFFVYTEGKTKNNEVFYSAH